MADFSYQSERAATALSHPNWGAIWAGVFSFVAIWSIFGLLGTAIFATEANLAATRPATGMSVGMGVWSIILSIIAMYVAGRTTGHFAQISNPRDGAFHGMIMFGLSVAGIIVLTELAGIGGVNETGAAHSAYLLAVFSNIGWIGFVSLFLGWLAAMGGASTGTLRRTPTHRAIEQPTHA